MLRIEFGMPSRIMLRIEFGMASTYNVSFWIIFFSSQKFVLSTNVYSLSLTPCAATFDCRSVHHHKLSERPLSVLVRVIDLVIDCVIGSSSNVGVVTAVPCLSASGRRCRTTRWDWLIIVQADDSVAPHVQRFITIFISAKPILRRCVRFNSWILRWYS